MAKMRAGFIGMGDIGLPMAKNVVTKGFETTVCGNVRRQPIEEMVALGAKEAPNPKGVAENSDAVIIMVRNDAQAADVIMGPNGLLEGFKDGSAIILMGTYAPDFMRNVAEAGKPKKIDVLDAPVVGARMGAAAGTLGISVGGDPDAVEKYRQLIETMGTITYCGPLGMGQIVKMANNICATVHAWVAYEAVNWGIANGAEEEMLVKHIQNGSGSSFIIQNWDWIKSLYTDPPPSTYYSGAEVMSHVLEIGLQLRLPCPFTAMTCELTKGPPPRLLEGPLTSGRTQSKD